MTRFYALPRFEISREMRGGLMVYEEHGWTLEFRWEMSAVPEHNILLAPLHLSRWTVPSGEPIPVSKQLQILARLRDWLSNQGIKSDIEQPPPADLSQRCVSADCMNPRLDGVAQCALHFDMMLLSTGS